jgi:hypothetical protein
MWRVLGYYRREKISDQCKQMIRVPEQNQKIGINLTPPTGTF